MTLKKNFAFVNALGILFLFAFLFPLCEDRFLLQSSFCLNNGQPSNAIQYAKLASLFAPLDVAPLHRLKDIYVSEENSDGAKLVLHRLLELKKDYPPYYSELAALEMHDRRLNYCQKYLEAAQKLDPYSILNETTYFTKATLAKNQNDESEYQKNLSLAFIYPQSYQQSLLALQLSEDLDPEKFIKSTLEFIDANTDSNEDQLSSIDYFNNNLVLIRKAKWSERLLELALQDPKLIQKQEDRDYYSYLLQETYAANGESTKLRPLRMNFSKAAVTAMDARLLIEEGSFPEAKKKLKEALSYYKYEELAAIWDSYFRHTQQWDDLVQMYRVIERLPSNSTVVERHSNIAEIYVARAQFANAAREFHEISMYHYDDPVAHSREARFWWLAGDFDKARKANQQLQRLIPNNPLYRNLYRSNIETSVWQGVTVVRALVPNDLSGLSFRTGLFLHPPLRISFPQDMRLSKISGEIALVGGTWFEGTDGARFAIKDSEGTISFQYRLDPKNDFSQRRWNSISWKANAPQNIVFATYPGANNSFDWLVLSVREAQ